MFNVNAQSGVPIYRQLMDQVRRMIASGRLRPGDELPSVRQLSLAHTVNTMTVSKAYSLLEAEGLLQRQRGKAMTVACDAKTAETKVNRLQHLQQNIEQLALAAKQLELSPTDVVNAVRERLEKHDD